MPRRNTERQSRKNFISHNRADAEWKLQASVKRLYGDEMRKFRRIINCPVTENRNEFRQQLNTGWEKSFELQGPAGVYTWNFAAVEGHGDVVNRRVLRHEWGVEIRAGLLLDVARDLPVVDNDLDVAAAGIARIDCTRETRLTCLTVIGNWKSNNVAKIC